MTGSVAIDVVIGLIFVYLLYSLLATLLQEIIATSLDFRQEFLEKAIKRMLDDESKTAPAKPLSKVFYANPLIKYLARKNQRPAYLTSSTFAKVLVDILRGDDAKAGDDFRPVIQNSLRNGFDPKLLIDASPKGDTFKFLRSVWADSQGDLEKFRVHLEQWFDDTMDRTTGWYKRRTQIVLGIVGLLIAVLFNVDTLDIVYKLQINPSLRAQIVQQADAFVKSHPNLDREMESQKLSNWDVAKSDSARLRALNASTEDEYTKMKVRRDTLVARSSRLIKGDIKEVNSLLGMGIYNYSWRGWSALLKSIAGWILTALAISLGAPFWFDLLNKFMKLKSSIAVAGDNKASNPDKGVDDKGSRTIMPKG